MRSWPTIDLTRSPSTIIIIVHCEFNVFVTSLSQLGDKRCVFEICPRTNLET